LAAIHRTLFRIELHHDGKAAGPQPALVGAIATSAMPFAFNHQ
jgi:hypothetical protein